MAQLREKRPQGHPRANEGVGVRDEAGRGPPYPRILRRHFFHPRFLGRWQYERMRIAYVEVDSFRDLSAGELVQVGDQFLSLPPLGRVVLVKTKDGLQRREVVGHVLPAEHWWQNYGEPPGGVVVLLAQTERAVEDQPD